MGSHEKSVPTLINLSKKEEQDFFNGCKRKKYRKKEIKVKQTLNDWVFGDTDHQSEEPRTQDESLTLNEITQSRKALLKLERFERLRRVDERNLEVKQRLAEENYIQEQENLAETWMDIIQRKKQLRQEGYQFSDSRGRNYNRNIISISLLSRKYWNDEPKGATKTKSDVVCKQKKKPKPDSKPKQVVNDLAEKLKNELVFVYNESDDELQCGDKHV